MEGGVTTIQGTLPGPKVVIMAGVHGDEPCGFKAIRRMRLESRQIDRGQLTIVRYANPRAVKSRKRQTEMNLNRAFRPGNQMTAEERNTYEYGRARELMPILRNCHALLDIHSARTSDSTPFIICEPQSYGIAARLPFGIRSRGWDVIEAGGTDYYVNEYGGLGICIECGNHHDPEATDIACESINTFLILTGLMKGDLPADRKQRVIHAYSIYKTRTNFKPARDFADFERLKSGELIGYDGEEKLTAPFAHNNLIIFPVKRDKPGEEAYILGVEE